MGHNLRNLFKLVRDDMPEWKGVRSKCESEYQAWKRVAEEVIREGGLEGKVQIPEKLTEIVDRHARDFEVFRYIEERRNPERGEDLLGVL